VDHQNPPQDELAGEFFRAWQDEHSGILRLLRENAARSESSVPPPKSAERKKPKVRGLAFRL